MSEQKPILSAAKGAEIAKKQRAAAQTKEVQEAANSKISWDRTRPVQDAIERASRIDGVDVSFSPQNQGDRVYSTLTVGSQSYAVIIDAHEGGYAIYKNEEYPTADRQYAEYEGGSKNLEEALGGIAMILGNHYPDHASNIDQAIGNSQRETVPEPPSPKS
jgi:hypothetical protein